TDARNQFDRTDRAVSPRLAVRLACLHGFAMNIGTADSTSAAAAMTVTMTLRLVRKSRSDIGSSSSSAIVEVGNPMATDEYLIFLSGSRKAFAVADNEGVDLRGRNTMMIKSSVAIVMAAGSVLCGQLSAAAQDVPGIPAGPLDARQTGRFQG